MARKDFKSGTPTRPGQTYPGAPGEGDPLAGLGYRGIPPKGYQSYLEEDFLRTRPTTPFDVYFTPDRSGVPGSAGAYGVKKDERKDPYDPTAFRAPLETNNRVIREILDELGVMTKGTSPTRLAGQNFTGSFQAGDVDTRSSLDRLNDTVASLGDSGTDNTSLLKASAPVVRGLDLQREQRVNALMESLMGAGVQGEQAKNLQYTMFQRERLLREQLKRRKKAAKAAFFGSIPLVGDIVGAAAD